MRGLGKDFSALIPDDMLSEALAIEAATDGERVEQIAIALVEPNPDQPRKLFDEDKMRELAQSIEQHGIVQPLIVVKNGEGYFIIAGERRWRAARDLGHERVPAIIRTFDDQQRLEVALIENVQRQDLTVMDQAAAYYRLHSQFNLNYPEIAKRVGKSPSAVNNIARLLKLPREAIDALNRGQIVEGHARQLLALESAELQLELLDLIIKNKWTVRQAEQFVIGHKEDKSSTKSSKAMDKIKTETKESKRLAKKLGTTVSVKHMAKGGRLVIDFKDDAHLEKLISTML